MHSNPFSRFGIFPLNWGGWYFPSFFYDQSRPLPHFWLISIDAPQTCCRTCMFEFQPKADPPPPVVSRQSTEPGANFLVNFIFQSDRVLPLDKLILMRLVTLNYCCFELGFAPCLFDQKTNGKITASCLQTSHWFKVLVIYCQHIHSSVVLFAAMY